MKFSEDLVKDLKAFFPENQKLHLALDRNWFHDVERILNDHLKDLLDPDWIVSMFKQGSPDFVLWAAENYQKVATWRKQVVELRSAHDREKRLEDSRED